jgi:hypothetical protein
MPQALLERVVAEALITKQVQRALDRHNILNP